MFALLSQRNFFLLWMANTISILGDYIFFIAITFWMYEQTSSALVTGSLLICSTVPAILFAPLAGKVVDSWDRRRVMFLAESARALLFLGLLGSLIVAPHTLWPIYLVGFLQSALAAFFWPARSASIPHMIEPDSLLAANALYTFSDGVVRIIAPTLAAFALLHLGSPGVVALDAATFIVSAGSICFLTLPGKYHRSEVSSPEEQPSPDPDADEPERRASWIARRLPFSFRVYGLFFLGSVITYIAGTLNLLMPIFIQTVLAVGPLGYGWMFTAQAIGEGVMSLLLLKASPNTRRAGRIGITSSCLAIEGGVLLLQVHLHALVPALFLNLIFGMVTAAITVQIMTDLQQSVKNRVLGRVMTSYSALQAIAQVGGMGIVSATVGQVGVIWLLVFDGLVALVASGLAWVLLEGKTRGALGRK